MPLSGDAKRELWELFIEETKIGKRQLELSATELHQRLEKQDSSGQNMNVPNRIAVCGAVLLAMMNRESGDELTSESGCDPAVRFVLPRPTAIAPAA